MASAVLCVAVPGSITPGTAARHSVATSGPAFAVTAALASVFPEVNELRLRSVGKRS